MNQRTFAFKGENGGCILVPQMNVEFATFSWDATSESYRITFYLVSGKTVSDTGFTKGHLTEVEGFLEGRRFTR